MAWQQRPLLIPSPRTAGVEELPYTPVFIDQLKESKSVSHTTKSPFGMDSNTHSEISTFPESFHSSSRRSMSSNRFRDSRAGSIKEEGFGGLGSRGMRNGSYGAGSEGFSRSLKEISDEDARLVYINDPSKTNENFEFARNSIRTAKYSIITFLPRNLFEQFHRVAYIYFLVIAILNQIPQMAVFGREASILPLAFVLFVTAVKDAYEDYRRHRSDKVENHRLASVLINGQFQQKKWKDVMVGEIIKISSGEPIPCDMVLLSTSDTTGVAYIQTINLDGESNLKTRYAKQETQMKNPENEKVDGLIKCEKPSRNIYGFQANMEIEGKRVSLGPSNIILRGCDLKNTAWAIGVVVYAGQETKAMLNNSGAPSKRSRLETRMNREIIILSFFLVALCTVVSICAGVWLRHHKDDLDIIPFFRRKDYSETEVENYNYYGWGAQIVFTFLMCVIVYQVMIPISLYISMELVRIGQAYFMIQDNRMFDEASNSRFQCRALNINEDLGQVKYVFSDKTGTLTENKMEFQCASIWGVDYGSTKSSLVEDQFAFNVQVDGQVLRPKMKVMVDPELIKISKAGKHTDQGKRIHDFFLALAACNTIVPITEDSSDPAVKLIEYQGESPDEQALVYAAAAYGFMLIERTSGHIVIDIQGEKQRFNVLGLHEFDSDRKRMSVILGCPDNTIKLFVKGADTTMFSVIDTSLNSDIVHATESHLHSYSSTGLRTLVVGMRELSASELERWQSSYEAASTAVIGRAALLRKVAIDIESNLSILGASGIEDKLQQGVPEAIESLREAGIKVWVLTGDKQETAISIGYSSKLLTSTMTHITIKNSSKDSCKRSLEDGLRLTKKHAAHNSEANSVASTSSVALIIDGTSLVHILDSELEEQLFQLASNCTVVLCCRVAPLQKAGIVALIKSRTDDMTLAIGDGANDVSMIQTADVGIGISGQEGRQAVMASDFAMAQFRFLVPLLLVHGHWNYQRLGYMILYNFYRNAILVLVLFWYALFTAFTLTTAITDWSSVLYSIIYSSLPTIVVGVLDKDVSRTTLLKYPQLYGAGQREESYNGKLFWVMILDTVWQSAVAFFVPLIAYWKRDIDISSLGDLWILAVVILVNLHLAMDVIRWNWITHASIWGSIVATVICVIIIDALPFLPGYWAIFHVAGDATFWLCLIVIIVAALVPRFIVKVFVQHFTPSDIQIAREEEKFGHRTVSHDAEIEMNPVFDSPQ
nr:phospholipid-transporting ATPase 1 [Ipomoea batatas]GME17546.1 phospholipid-transporting ATPase 1 [Ipomoea batatas]